MPLWDSPPHSVTLYSVASGRDAGGGVLANYTSAQASVACSINTPSAAEVEQFAQMGIQVTHVVAILTELLTVTPDRGWKAVADDSGASFHIEGIRRGRAYANVPAFTYLQCRELL